VRIVQHSKNEGLAAARNTALRHSQHEIVASVDADVVPEADWLERLLPCFNDPTVGAAGGALHEAVIRTLADRWRAVHYAQSWGEREIVDPPFLTGSNLVVRKSAIRDAGWYDERFRTNGEDVEMSQRLRNHGYHLVYQPCARARHLRSDTVMSLFRLYWRAWVFGTQAYFGGISVKEMWRNFWHSHLRGISYRMARLDVANKRYCLVWLDLALLFYLLYRDVRLFASPSLRREFRRLKPLTSSEG